MLFGIILNSMLLGLVINKKIHSNKLRYVILFVYTRACFIIYDLSKDKKTY